MLAIHTASEDYMVKIFEAAQLNAIHGKQITILPKDMQLSKWQRQIFDDNNC
jgi:histone H3